MCCAMSEGPLALVKTLKCLQSSQGDVTGSIYIVHHCQGRQPCSPHLLDCDLLTTCDGRQATKTGVDTDRQLKTVTPPRALCSHDLVAVCKASFDTVLCLTGSGARVRT